MHNPTYTMMHFEFLTDIGKLIVAARRAISFTYAMRYYLKGKFKQEHFDFIQAELESSLERLNGKAETNWLDLLDVEVDGRPHLGDRFFTFKAQVTNLTQVLMRHFNNMMKEIRDGLPSAPEDKEDEATDYTFSTAQVGKEWKCLSCYSVNQTATHPDKCSVCGRERINITYQTFKKT